MTRQSKSSSAIEKISANLRSPSKSPGSKPHAANPTTKADNILSLLRRSKGASVDEMTSATGWQNHSKRQHDKAGRPSPRAGRPAGMLIVERLAEAQTNAPGAVLGKVIVDRDGFTFEIEQVDAAGERRAQSHRVLASSSCLSVSGQCHAPTIPERMTIAYFQGGTGFASAFRPRSRAAYVALQRA